MSLFRSLNLAPELVQVTQELGYTKATEIQEKAIPLLLEGRDVIGQSKTGSGKTAAFTLPLLNKLSKLNLNLQNNVQTHALILCPTRELCTQVAREIRKLGRRNIGLRVIMLSGGQPIGPQIHALEGGVHIIVGTPGRVLDHVRKGSLQLETISTLILDEADRMLDMGFEEEMSQIFEKLPSERQAILFSATFPPSIENISARYQKNAVRVTVENTEIAPAIDQKYLIVEPSSSDDTFQFTDKAIATMWVLSNYEPESSIIFCNFKASAAELAQELKRHGVSADTLHGDLEQAERDSVMAKFRNQSTRVLVATDVAARGIDVNDLDLVLNFEIPKQNEIYVHRIGRTGRAGKTGVAVTLAIPKEENKIEAISAFTNQPIEKLESDTPLTSLSFNDLKNDLHQSARMETLFISGGRKNKVRPGDILGALTGEAGGLDGKFIGKIEIHDFFSYVAVATKYSRTALTRLRDGRIKGRKFRVELAR